MRSTHESDDSRERHFVKNEDSKPGQGLDLVSLSSPEGKEKQVGAPVENKSDSKSDSKADKKNENKGDKVVPNHIDFTPDPYKTPDIKKPGEISTDSKSDAKPESKPETKLDGKPEVKSVDERLADGRKAMDNLAEKHMTQKYPSMIDGKLYSYDSTFKGDMNKLEDRMKNGQVSKEEVAKTYEAITKLVDSPSDVTSQGKRLQLAKNIMFHAGDPTKTDQGPYQTCALTSEGERLFTRNPGTAANIISDAATTGKWTAPDGKEIKLDKQSLQPQPGSLSGQPIDGERSYATQVLNNVLANDIHQRKDKPESYVQLFNRDKTGRPLGPEDSGERVYTAKGNEATNPDGGKLRAPQVNSAEVAAQIKRLTGDTNIVMINKKLTEVQEGVEGGAGARKGRKPEPMDIDTGKDAVLLSSAKDLSDNLQRLKEQGKFPAIVGLDGGDRLLNKGLPKPPGTPVSRDFEGHMLSVTDYDPGKGMVRISNQWGQASDRWLSVKDLYKATDPETMRR